MFLRSATEQTLASIGAKMTAGGSVTATGSGIAGITLQAANPDAVTGGIILADIGIVVGIFVGVAGLLTQLFFQWDRRRREVAFHKAQMYELEKSAKKINP